MALGLIGVKRGMSRVFTEDGLSIPVTVVEVAPNYVTRVKRQKDEGYSAVQISWGDQKATRVNLPKAGLYKKAGLEAGKGLCEFRALESEVDAVELGQEIGVSMFSEGDYVDASGISIGKGFAGTVKRHNFKMQDATHGNSLSHRVGGSIGQCQTPGRVFKGKKMAGQMGNKKRTVQKLKVIKVDSENNILFVKGATPGAKGGQLMIVPSVKSKKASKR